MTESEIIRGCIKYDRNAQKALYELYYATMMGVCLRFSKNTEEAKTILKEGFLKVFHTIASLNSILPSESWIRTIIINTAIEYLRRNRQEYLIVSTVNAYEKTEGYKEETISDDELLNRLGTEDIIKALQRLTPAYRIVFNLYFIEKLSTKEIGEKLGINEDTAKTNLSKARFNMKKFLIQTLRTFNGRQ